MTTLNQERLIRELLAELGWSRDDVARKYGEEFWAWEDVDDDLASELIDDLIQMRRRQDAQRRRLWWEGERLR